MKFSSIAILSIIIFPMTSTSSNEPNPGSIVDKKRSTERVLFNVLSSVMLRQKEKSVHSHSRKLGNIFQRGESENDDILPIISDWFSCDDDDDNDDKATDDGVEDEEDIPTDAVPSALPSASHSMAHSQIPSAAPVPTVAPAPTEWPVATPQHPK